MPTLPRDEMIDAEETIYREFSRGPLSFHGAIIRLCGIGYAFDDAHDMVCEWADALDHESRENHDDDDEV
jgi:hypothetical protein